MTLTTKELTDLQEIFELAVVITAKEKQEKQMILELLENMKGGETK